MFLGFGLDAWITIVTLVMVMCALMLTQLRADLVFLSAVGVLFVTGVLNANEAFAGFISTPVLIIGVMCVVVAGLSSTGVIQRISRHVLGKPKGEIQALMRLTLSCDGRCLASLCHTVGTGCQRIVHARDGPDLEPL